MPSSAYILKDLRYREEKKKVSVRFESENDKITQNYSFTPFFTLHTENINSMRVLLKDLNIISVKEGPLLKVFGENFSELKQAYSLLCSALNARPVLLEPERQFLLAKGWSYFDVFSAEKFEKINALPVIESVCREKVFSNILRVPIETVNVLNSKIAANIFLENVLFCSGGFPAKNPLPFLHRRFSFQEAEKAAFLIAENNIGYETIECSKSKNRVKAIASSTAKIRFLSNAFYFNSSLPCYSTNYHFLHSEKNSRIARMREFFLKEIPTGPFFAGQCETVPVADAINIVREGDAEFVGIDCIKTVSSQHASALAKTISELLELINACELNSKKTEGIEFESSDSFDCRQLLSAIISKLLSESSLFFCYDLASAVYASFCPELDWKTELSVERAILPRI